MGFWFCKYFFFFNNEYQYFETDHSNKNQGMSKYVGACEDTYFPILLSDSTIFDKFTVIFYVLQKDQNSTEHIILQYQDNPFSKNQCQK